VRLPHAETRAIRGPAGEIPLRILRPKGEARGVYLHFHGGGFALGSEDMMDPAHDALANAAGAVVVSVGYRLAPEHPYPAGPDDCEAAALWLAEHALRELGTERIALGGESAGAHLAAITLVRLRDRHGAAPFCAANLVYGCYDLSLTPSARNWGERNLILSTPILDWFADMWVPDRASARPRRLAALRGSSRPPARPLQRRHARPPARRLALHGRALDGRRKPRRARRLPGRGARLQPLPARDHKGDGPALPYLRVGRARLGGRAGMA
jgi:acetyl esterase/lipase